MARFRINVALKKAEDKRPSKISLIIRYQSNCLKPKICSHPILGDIILRSSLIVRHRENFLHGRTHPIWTLLKRAPGPLKTRSALRVFPTGKQNEEIILKIISSFCLQSIKVEIFGEAAGHLSTLSPAESSPLMFHEPEFFHLHLPPRPLRIQGFYPV